MSVPKKGSEAFEQYYGIEDNPFDIDTVEYREWQEDWEKAEEAENNEDEDDNDD